MTPINFERKLDLASTLPDLTRPPPWPAAPASATTEACVRRARVRPLGSSACVGRARVAAVDSGSVRVARAWDWVPPGRVRVCAPVCRAVRRCVRHMLASPHH